MELGEVDEELKVFPSAFCVPCEPLQLSVVRNILPQKVVQNNMKVEGLE